MGEISKNKKGRILVTFAGGNDPLGRGVYKKEEDSKEQSGETTNAQPNSKEEISTDGPIIRICRFYRPEKIYLLLTNEMKKLNDKNIYEEAIKANIDSYECEIIPIEIGIDKAHLFDIYSDKIYDIFDKMKGEHSDDEILINISSGTPQMISNLVNYIVNSTGLKVTPIQVATPQDQSNYANTSSGRYDNYNAEAKAKTNQDKIYFDEVVKNSETYQKIKKDGDGNIYDTDLISNVFDELQQEKNSITQTRIITPDLDYYRRVLIRGNIEKLLQKFEYENCINLLEQKVFKNQDQIEILLKFAQKRKELQGIDSNNDLIEFATIREENLKRKSSDNAANDSNNTSENSKTSSDAESFADLEKFVYFDTKAKKKDIPLWYMIVDYYALAKMKAEIGDCAGYTLMLEPITTNLYLSILQDVFKQKLENIFEEEKLPIDKPNTQHNLMYKFTNYNYLRLDNGNFCKSNKINENNKYVNTYILEEIINYFIRKETNKKTNKKGVNIWEVKRIYENLKKRLGKVKKLRNAFAHSLNSIPIEDFKTITNVDIAVINGNIEKFFEKFYTEFGYEKDMIDIYKNLNKMILDMLEIV